MGNETQPNAYLRFYFQTWETEDCFSFMFQHSFIYVLPILSVQPTDDITYKCEWAPRMPYVITMGMNYYKFIFLCYLCNHHGDYKDCTGMSLNPQSLVWLFGKKNLCLYWSPACCMFIADGCFCITSVCTLETIGKCKVWVCSFVVSMSFQEKTIVEVCYW